MVRPQVPQTQRLIFQAARRVCFERRAGCGMSDRRHGFGITDLALKSHGSPKT